MTEESLSFPAPIDPSKYPPNDPHSSVERPVEPRLQFGVDVVPGFASNSYNAGNKRSNGGSKHGSQWTPERSRRPGSKPICFQSLFFFSAWLTSRLPAGLFACQASITPRSWNPSVMSRNDSVVKVVALLTAAAIAISVTVLTGSQVTQQYTSIPILGAGPILKGRSMRLNPTATTVHRGLRQGLRQGRRQGLRPGSHQGLHQGQPHGPISVTSVSSSASGSRAKSHFLSPHIQTRQNLIARL
eukprot:1244583-Amorphochlora_amoeboformis.AAC.1